MLYHSTRIFDLSQAWTAWRSSESIKWRVSTFGSRPKRRGFTLVEIVVVVLILGILGAVAAPKMVAVNSKAEENALRQSLAVIRDAIQYYAAEHDGVLPGKAKDDSTFKAELTPYLRKVFPKNPFDDNGNKADIVKFRHQGDPLVDHVGADPGWLYDNTTGEFIANTDTLSSDGVKKYSEF